MLRIRIRIRPRTAVAASAAVLAALSLSACDGSSSDARSPGHAAADAATARPGDNADGKENGSNNGSNNNGSGKESGSGSSSSAGKNSAPANSPAAGKAPGQASGSSDACTGDNVTAVITKVPRPLNHLLLTITNKGSRSCNAYFAPSLRFDDEQSATQVNEDSKPQAVATVAPGRSVYASVLLSSAAGGTHGRTARKLTVYFTPRSGSGSTGAPVTLSLPTGTHKDDNASVTYWQNSAADALQF
ncbi:DUF4232 domain-containing protein [Streptomyces sp. NBC_01456]|uniref:DUF4232 domain-containing protein n=1 Tax=unclassified Streptomyces TaxID=2593676 RepID=UPI002E31D723|nr:MULTISPECIES: DUF4232 domain-containing protein [unclassified Streptomyces]